MDNIVNSHNVITHGQPSNTLTTDASQNGWGVVYNRELKHQAFLSHERQPEVQSCVSYLLRMSCRP